MTHFELAVLCLLVLIVVLVLADLLVDIFGVRARRARVTLDELCDEGIALAAQKARNVDGLTSQDKHRIAATWATEQAKHLKLKSTPNEISRRIEVRLGKKKDATPS